MTSARSSSGRSQVSRPWATIRRSTVPAAIGQRVSSTRTETFGAAGRPGHHSLGSGHQREDAACVGEEGPQHRGGEAEADDSEIAVSGQMLAQGLLEHALRRPPEGGAVVEGAKVEHVVVHPPQGSRSGPLRQWAGLLPIGGRVVEDAAARGAEAESALRRTGWSAALRALCSTGQLPRGEAMPLEIVTVPCLSDNYAYLLRDGATGEVALVDAPEAGPIETALSERGWALGLILITHHHGDHIDGVDALRDSLRGARGGRRG